VFQGCDKEGRRNELQTLFEALFLTLAQRAPVYSGSVVLTKRGEHID
jgi:hypothetical protein